jgi:hypothetical protein
VAWDYSPRADRIDIARTATMIQHDAAAIVAMRIATFDCEYVEATIQITFGPPAGSIVGAKMLSIEIWCMDSLEFER